MGPVVCVLLFLHVAGVFAKVQLEPDTAYVLRGANATFNCSVNQQWMVMSWLLNGSVVLTISEQHGIMTNNPHFTAHNRSTAEESRWEFVILGVRRNDSGQVACDVQNVQRVTAQLFVQVSGTVVIEDVNKTVTQGELAYFQCEVLGWYPEPNLSWTVGGHSASVTSYNVSTQPTEQDLFNAMSTLGVVADDSTVVRCLASVPALATPRADSGYLTVVSTPTNINLTVVITVTVTVGAVLLFLLIIIILVCCCRWRQSKESRYQEEARKTRSQTDRGQGADNLGYTKDSHAGVSNGWVNDSAFSQPRSISTLQIPGTPDVREVSSPSDLYGQHNSTKKERQATIV